MKNRVKKWLLFILTLGTTSFSLTSCETSDLQNRIEDTVNNMLPNIYVTICQLAIFILTALVFIFLAYKPIKKKLNQRAEYIQNNISSSEKQKQEAADQLKKANNLILSSQQKASEIISQAQQAAEIKAADMQKEASQQIENQKIQAHKDIEAEKDKMLKQAHQEIVEAAINTSKEILKREVKVEDNSKFVDDFVNEITKEN